MKKAPESGAFFVIRQRGRPRLNYFCESTHLTSLAASSALT